jgi:aspartyl-tRNA(Asn)/glutamyl-tRNA(Gln) amidotransferase subunit A
MKPTYGRVSRCGLIAFASSLDQVGAFGRDVTDVALVLGAISGHDPWDSTNSDAPVPDYRAALGDGSLAGLRVGVPREYFVEGIDPEVERTVRAAIRQLANLGATVDEVSLPHTEHALAVYYLIAPAEASANLARYDGVKYGLSIRDDGDDVWDMYRKTRGRGFGAEVKRRIMLGTYALSAGYYEAYYLKAQQVRTLIKRDFELAFQRFDVLACPVSPTVAFKIGDRVADPLQMYLADIFTLSVSLAGMPGISVPCGFADGLPVGLQIVGSALQEPTVLRVAYAYEQATPWHERRPPLDRVRREEVA